MHCLCDDKSRRRGILAILATVLWKMGVCLWWIPSSASFLTTPIFLNLPLNLGALPWTSPLPPAHPVRSAPPGTALSPCVSLYHPTCSRRLRPDAPPLGRNNSGLCDSSGFQKCHRLGGLSRRLFSHNSGRWTSKVRAPTQLDPG